MQNGNETFIERLRKVPIKSILWWGIGIGFIIGCAFNRYSGYDWIIWFRPQALEMRSSFILNPMWTYIPLYPVAMLPTRISFAVFSALNLVALFISIQLSKTNRFYILLSFPVFWIFWYGQLDMLVMFGAILGLWALDNDKHILNGIAILLLLVKPHIGGPLAITYMYWSRNWKMLLTMAGVFFISLLIWGYQWPINWINNLLHASVKSRIIQEANIGYFPYGLISCLGLFIPMSRKDKSLYILCATITSFTYVGTYSLIAILGFAVPWWAYLLSSAPYVLGTNGYWITSLVPILLMLFLIIKNTRLNQYAISFKEKIKKLNLPFISNKISNI